MPAQPAPVALLLNLGSDTPKGAALHALLADAGVRAVDVPAAQLGLTVGRLVEAYGSASPDDGAPIFASASAPASADRVAVPATEFLLLANLPDDQAVALFRAMRQAGAVVGCKAMVTPHNQDWPLIELVEEVAAEHAKMSQLRSAPQ